jgi:hypothetical protein
MSDSLSFCNKKIKMPILSSKLNHCQIWGQTCIYYKKKVRWCKNLWKPFLTKLYLFNGRTLNYHNLFYFYYHWKKRKKTAYDCPGARLWQLVSKPSQHHTFTFPRPCPASHRSAMCDIMLMHAFLCSCFVLKKYYKRISRNIFRSQISP